MSKPDREDYEWASRYDDLCSAAAKRSREGDVAGESGVRLSPGPWIEDGEQIYDATGKAILLTGYGQLLAKENPANLALAAGAPELRDALQRIAAIGPSTHAWAGDAHWEMRQIARAALAKAGRAQAGPVEPEE